MTDIYNPEGTVCGVEYIYQNGMDGGGAMMPHAEMNEMMMPNRVPDPADENDVLREQLEYLIDHVTGQGICGCSGCERYLRVRSVLLEIFSEPEPEPAQRQLTALPAAA